MASKTRDQVGRGRGRSPGEKDPMLSSLWSTASCQNPSSPTAAGGGALILTPQMWTAPDKEVPRDLGLCCRHPAPGQQLPAPVYFSEWLPKQGGRPGAPGARSGSLLSSVNVTLQPVPRRKAYQTLSLSLTLPYLLPPFQQPARSPGRQNSAMHSPKGQNEDHDRNA